MHLVSNIINWPISTSLFFPFNGYLQMPSSQWSKETGTSLAQLPLLQPVLCDKLIFTWERIFGSTNLIWNNLLKFFSKIYTNLSVNLSPKSVLLGDHAALANTSTGHDIPLQLSYKLTDGHETTLLAFILDQCISPYKATNGLKF